MGLAAMGGLAMGQPQQGDLHVVAAAAQTAWLRHDMAGLVQSGEKVLVFLPGTEPSAPVGRAQAAALLSEHVRGYEEAGVEIKTVRELDDEERGVVGLLRRYRVVGTVETRTQSLLLVYRHAPAGWVLTEVRVSR